MKHERIRWFTDNQNVVRIVQYGSSKPLLQAEALGIFSTCVQHNIRLEPEWIPREKNELADYYSQIVDCDDWMLNPLIFAWLDTIWGPHMVDRLQMPEMPSCQGSIQDSGSLAQRLWMLLLAPGWEKIIGGAHLFTWSPGH